MMIKKRYKIALVVFTAFLSVTLLSVGVLAFFTDRASSRIEAVVGDVNVRLVEDFPITNDYGAVTDTKVFRGVSLGSKRTYVRASIFCTIEYMYSGTDPATGLTVQEWRPVTSIPTSAVLYDIVPNSDWAFWDDGGRDEGYWYYTKILKKGEETTDFVIENIRIDEEQLSPETVGFKLRVNMKVRLDSSQATHETYKDNFKITDLPPQVERIDYNDDGTE